MKWLLRMQTGGRVKYKAEFIKSIGWFEEPVDNLSALDLDNVGC